MGPASAAWRAALGPIAAIRTCLFEKYATFSGRASRSEFWWFVGFSAILPRLAAAPIFIEMVRIRTAETESPAAAMDAAIERLGVLLHAPALVGALLLIPFCAVAARRVHDRGLAAAPFAFVAAMAAATTLGALGDAVFWALGGVEDMLAWADATERYRILALRGTILAMAIGMIWPLCGRGTAGGNRFGPDPLAPEGAQADAEVFA